MSEPVPDYWKPRGPWLGLAVRDPDGHTFIGSARLTAAPPIVDRRGVERLYDQVICARPTNIPTAIVHRFLDGPLQTVPFPKVSGHTPGRRCSRIIALDDDYIWEASGYHRHLLRRPTATIACRWPWDTEWERLPAGEPSAFPSGLPIYPFISHVDLSFPHAVGLSVPRHAASTSHIPPATASNGTATNTLVPLGSRWTITDTSHEQALEALDDGTRNDYTRTRNLLDTLRRFGGLAVDTHAPFTEIGVISPVGLFTIAETLAFQRATRKLTWQQAL